MLTNVEDHFPQIFNKPLGLSLLHQQYPPTILPQLSNTIRIKREAVLSLVLVAGVEDKKVRGDHCLAHLHLDSAVGICTGNVPLRPPDSSPVEEDDPFDELAGLRTLVLEHLAGRWRAGGPTV